MQPEAESDTVETRLLASRDVRVIVAPLLTPARLWLVFFVPAYPTDVTSSLCHISLLIPSLISLVSFPSLPFPDTVMPRKHTAIKTEPLRRLVVSETLISAIRCLSVSPTPRPEGTSHRFLAVKERRLLQNMTVTLIAQSTATAGRLTESAECCGQECDVEE